MFWIFWHKNQLNIFISYFYHSRSTLKILSHGAFGILIVCNHVICIYRLRTNCTMSLRCIITLQHSISGHTINRKGKTLLMIKVMCQVFNQWIFFPVCFGVITSLLLLTDLHSSSIGSQQILHKSEFQISATPQIHSFLLNALLSTLFVSSNIVPFPIKSNFFL